ncbi:AmmeMemoRadiSam system protein A [Methylicorpusculum sp.]|uniref:AmmeMemoRadiSam system protein A n=1 Tax=Methylicorpusculum sp. TaxID=2713644 RepID=UPI002730FF73|nr:AmmeMemoRadiSam system protein A [Methylicorpusculum sp.]MDP2179713.1 AmmeMemoRadiSam system protein A [Methylicorpusculum sp.]MDP3529833.1 AmmeMemoRadiSam system protein A [Methylicorpusculum sp.]MDZ4152747.1 AmmeMemoRadiSam system protein A [Methylicorpusculum sp.]
MWLIEAHQQRLISVARASIAYGLKTGRALPVILSEYPPELQAMAATFVTLERQHELRGCIGMLQAVRPLVQDVAENAFAAAFRDHRFAPLSEAELDGLELHISILSAPEPMVFSSEQDLLAQLRPGIDGLILEDGSHRGTFLPSVWESLSNPRDFLNHLKQKAGLSAHYWSDSLKLSRYTASVIHAIYR